MILAKLTEMELINDEANVAGTEDTAVHQLSARQRHDAFIKHYWATAGY